MIFLIYKSWVNTAGNHAGMQYLCEKLEENYINFKAIEMPDLVKQRSNLTKRLNKLGFYWRSMKAYKTAESFVEKLNLTNKDSILLVEYMDLNVGQIYLSEIIRKRFPKICIGAIAHLVPGVIESSFTNSQINKWVKPIDYLITFGSSLSDFYKSKGIPKSKIFTLFHYVDDYYINNNIQYGQSYKVLIQGNMMRDIKTLQEIISRNSNIHFFICQGMKDLSKEFNTENVTLLPYLKESELKEYMYYCPVSLNVMHDTIGSNVIVTSMGMGQALICSDVGSIRNYCNPQNSILCNSIDDFSTGLNKLSKNKHELYNMRKNSVEFAKSLSIKKFANELLNIFNNNSDSNKFI